MTQYDDPGAAVEPPLLPSSRVDLPGEGTPEGPVGGTSPSELPPSDPPPLSDPAPSDPERPRPRRLRRAGLVLLVLLLAGGLGLGIALAANRLLLADDSPAPTPSPTASASTPPSSAPETPSPSTSPSPDPTAGRTQAVEDLLAQRARALQTKDRDLFMSTVDPTATDFYTAQGELFDRVAALEMAEWSYQVVGDGPALTLERAAALPPGSGIVRTRLTYKLAGTETTTDREQYLTAVQRDGRWLLASDTDASAAGLDTERDLWDLGPVTAVRGDTSLVLADTRGATKAQMQRIADEADLAVRDVDDVWTGEWSHEPVILLPRSQEDMATLIDSDGDGLSQIAAVTTGAFESGQSRGDRVVINPAAWNTLGALGRRVVLTHEMTHVATRASSAQPVPIWLSEGFADYVAYQATPVPTVIVASDVIADIHDGKGPKHLPDDADFDASRGDIAASYESAWLASRMIAEKYGEKKLVQLYSALSDSAGPGWPDETVDVLGITKAQLVRDWKAYLREKAAS